MVGQRGCPGRKPAKVRAKSTVLQRFAVRFMSGKQQKPPKSFKPQTKRRHPSKPRHAWKKARFSFSRHLSNQSLPLNRPALRQFSTLRSIHLGARGCAKLPRPSPFSGPNFRPFSQIPISTAWRRCRRSCSLCCGRLPRCGCFWPWRRPSRPVMSLSPSNP